MLSVGREINIQTKETICRACLWEGQGTDLLAGLVRIADTPIYLCAYRCRSCASFDITCKGKLLEFRSLDPNERKRPNKDSAEDSLASLEA
jgi:hypothetical protein